MKTSPTLRPMTQGPSLIAVVLSSALFLGALPTMAQDTPAAPAPVAPTSASKGMESAFGVKGGANWSNLWVKEVNDQNARFGFHVGLFARVAGNSSLGFQIEALYDQKGNTVRKSYGVLDQEITFKLDYVTVPLLVVIPLGEVAELHGGAYLAYMVLSETRSTGDFGTQSTDPRDSRFNGFDYGLVGGIGINVGLAQVGVRYEHGLNEIANNNASQYVLGASKNSTLQAYLALALGK